MTEVAVEDMVVEAVVMEAADMVAEDMEAVDIVVVGQVGGQAVLGRQRPMSTPWLTERHGYDPTCPSGW